MWFLIQCLFNIHTLVRWVMFTLKRYYRVHSEMPDERKKKKGTPYTLERTPGLLGNEEYVFTPLTYVSVDESVGSNAVDGPEVGTKCQE